LPEVRLLLADEIPAGTRSQLQRRLLAFARDSVTRLLSQLGPVRSSKRAPLRAIAYQLEQGLGSAPRASLASALTTLSADDLSELEAGGVAIGALSVFVPALLGPRALSRRVTLLAAFQPETKLPPVGRATFDRQDLPAEAWMMLGYITLGQRALRIDLAERAAALFQTGASDSKALQCLSVPRRDIARVSALFRAAIAGPPLAPAPHPPGE
jgi:ATP-dependent RNA helicase SUPV3L1/SUV3